MCGPNVNERARPRLFFHLPLDPARLFRARQRIRDYLYEQEVEPAFIEDIMLAVCEAMSNAIRHSGALKDLEVCLSFRGGDLTAKVRDRGVGFDVESFDPSRRPDLLATSGLGLFLIARLMDEFSLQADGGLDVRFVKRDVLVSPQASTPGRPDLSVPGAQVHREARQRELLGEIEDEFLAFDWEYRLIYANEAACCFLARPAGELLGLGLAEFLPADRSSLGEAAEQAMQLGAPAVVEYESKLIGGRWFAARIYPTSYGISIFFNDITERRRKELQRDELLASLGESERQFSSLFEAMLEGVVLHELVFEDGRTIDYRILEANPAFERQTGLSRELARGRPASEFYGTGEAPYLDVFAHVAESGQPHSFETYFEPLDRHFQITAISPSAGRFATIFEDVTERKLAEEALRLSREDLDRAQAIGQIGSWRMDVRRNVLTWSDECYRIFGLAKGTTLTYETFLSVVHPDDRAFVDGCWQDALCGVAYDIEHRVLVEGEVKWVREKAFLERERSGELRGGFGITQDITERKRAEEALLRIATTLQEHLIHPLPAIAGIELAFLSLPAHRPELLGGDFHDVFEVADDRVVVLIGDVMGKGVKAAGLTETMHSAVRALSLVTVSPATILRHVNRLLLAEEYEQYVTALVVTIDPGSGRCRLASAGHPPPVVVSHGKAHLLEPRYGPPLGTFESTYAASAFDLAPDEALILYTDGLTEARGKGELFGEKRLLDTVRCAPDAAPQALIDHLRDVVLTYAGTLRDDLEILALRRTKRSQ